MIHEIRGQKVMFDNDLAELYKVETKYLNRTVKRHLKRFPADFMFQLTDRECEILRCQIVTSSWGGSRYLPYVFDEQIVELRKLLMLHIKNSDYKFSEYDETIKHIIHALNSLIERPPKTKKIGFSTD
jgi:hypothetical protein